MGSEVKQRALMKNIVGDNITAELGAFTVKRDGGGEEIKEVPFVYVPNLIRKATDLIEEHRGYYIHKVAKYLNYSFITP